MSTRKDWKLETITVKKGILSGLEKHDLNKIMIGEGAILDAGLVLASTVAHHTIALVNLPNLLLRKKGEKL